MRRKRLSGEIPLRLFDPTRGQLALSVGDLTPERHHPSRSNCFTILWIPAGRGVFHRGLDSYAFEGPVLLFGSPYQTLFIESSPLLEGQVILFHANFFCIETYHHEVGCNGVLFNDLNNIPLVQPDEAFSMEIQNLLQQMRQELQVSGLAHSEILVSYLKVLLIKATRLKLESQRQATDLIEPASKPVLLMELTDLIERHFKERLGPADYAQRLHISLKALGKLVKTHLGKTLTDLIRERTLQHAKWQLLHTLRPVKEVAAEAGFSDELYFSRVFKQETGLSPKAFREFETAIRGGRNLSMD
ncbi:AraC-type DNA-binding protein [Prosthecobacter debontii]|uniref:AraC-type DNA-binding protein n=1 Tax=Prosthecobacter debontii TaxID=48467 RepID=A0A1T4XTG6_9BACT|nr:AraC family transcriptional regulator [Prosthecobacter debontii]SKA92820.1 AraC-type DNA-binding protein [Prosthecobacter debontii]